MIIPCVDTNNRKLVEICLASSSPGKYKYTSDPPPPSFLEKKGWIRSWILSNSRQQNMLINKWLIGLENHYPDIEMTTHSMQPTRRIPNDFEQQDVILN